MVADVWDGVKDRSDIAPYEPPADWKDAAFGRVRAVRDSLLEDITDPKETDAGRLAWNAKLLSALVVLVGLEKVKSLLGGDGFPVAAVEALEQTTQSMAYLADAEGVTLEQFAFRIVGKFFNFSAFVWLADEKTQRAWDAIAALPDGVEGYNALPNLERQLRVEAEATVATLMARDA